MDALLEALKELLRVMLIAIIPVAIDMLQKGAIDYRTLAVVAVVAGLRAVEKFLYETNKDNPVSKVLQF